VTEKSYEMQTNTTLNKVVKGHRDVSPTNPNRVIVSAYVPVEELRKFDTPIIPWVNPRIGYTNEPGADKSRVRSSIKDAILLKDGKFHEAHLGVQLIANSATIEDGRLNIVFGNGENRGLGNGGTTTRVVCDMLKGTSPFVQSKDESKIQYVKVSVYCGDYRGSEVSDLVEGWNTNLQVDEFSMAHHRNAFEDIEKMLKKPVNGKSFPEVAYFFGDTGEYTIDQVLQLLCVFAMEEARSAYAGVGGCLRWFLSEEGNTRVMKVLPLVHDIFRLHETIAAESPELWNAKEGGGKWLGLKMNEHSKSAFHLAFLNVDIDYTPNKAWQLPVLASFRAAMDLDGNGAATWIVDSGR
jgi:hypothetical protein